MKSKIISEDIGEIILEFKKHLDGLQGKEILITGGNGFIPSYLVDTISTYNNNLRIPCRITVINKNKINESSRLSHLKSDPNVKFITQDVGQPFEVPGNPNIIIHAASRANPLSFKKEPLETIDVNVNGIRTLLDYSRHKTLEGFLFFSSSEVYGDPPKNKIPTPETYFGNVDCLGEMACYSESKRFCETIGESFFRKYNVPFKSLRIFHTFGPGIRDDGKTITNLFSQGINEGKMALRNSGDSRRAYSYISDTIRGILSVLFHGKPGEAYNVGTDLDSVSIKEMAEQIGVSLGGIPVIVPEENSRKRDPILDRGPDISKLKALGFVPKISTKEGINRLRDHYSEVGF